MFKKRNSIGITLIELMLALALSILIIGGIFEIYLIAENNRLIQTTVITMQEDAQMITQLFKGQIHAAAYMGCAKLTNDFPFKNNLPFKISQKNKIERYQDTDVKEGTDAIRIWHSSMQSAILNKTMQNHLNLYVTSNIPILVDDNLIISDCKTAESFRVKKIFTLENGMQKIITNVPLKKLYEKNAEINILEINSYFVSNTGRVDEHNQPIYALHIKDILGETTELAEGVDRMKVFFTRVENNKLVEYPASDIADASEIVGVSLAFELAAAGLKKNWNLYVALL